MSEEKLAQLVDDLAVERLKKLEIDLTIPELREAAIQYVLYELTIRKLNRPHTIPSATTPQLVKIVEDLR